MEHSKAGYSRSSTPLRSINGNKGNTVSGDKRTEKQWSFVLVGICFTILLFGILFYPMNIYRENIRYEIYRFWGSSLRNNRWEGGHREMAGLTYLFLGLGMTTLIAVVFFTLANSASPTPTGASRIISRFWKRKPLPRILNMTFGELAFVLLFVYVQAFWFMTYLIRYFKQLNDRNETDSNLYWEKVGHSFGFCAMIGFVFLAFPATRNSFWMTSLGVEYTQGIKYHRWISYFTFITMWAHCIPFYNSWLSSGTFQDRSFPCFDCDIGKEGRGRYRNFFGEIAVFCVTVMVITSQNWFRRNRYEVFYYSHHLFIVVVICLCLHYHNFVIWLYPAICLYVIHRLLARVQSQYPCEIVDIEARPGEVTRLVFRRSLKEGGNFSTGQFVYLRVPSISNTQWHPFTVSSSSRSSRDTFTVHVKALGGFTRALYATAIESKQQNLFPIIHVDGFYGKVRREFEHYPVIVLIAGGIGATPLLAILDHMLDVFKSGEECECREIWFYWTSREIGMFQEFEPLLNDIRAFDRKGEIFRIRLIFTNRKPQTNDEIVQVPDSVSLNKVTESNAIRRPYHESCKSPQYRAVIFLVVFGSSALLLGFIRYNYKLLGPDNTKLSFWPIQRIVELLVVVGSGLFGYFTATLEHRPVSSNDNVKITNDRRTGSRQSDGSMIHSYRGSSEAFSHPVSTSRLDVRNVLRSINEEYQYDPLVRKDGVGVFVSGPVGLIRSTEVEASTYGSMFDVHYEEFQL